MHLKKENILLTGPRQFSSTHWGWRGSEITRTHMKHLRAFCTAVVVRPPPPPRLAAPTRQAPHWGQGRPETGRGGSLGWGEGGGGEILDGQPLPLKKQPAVAPAVWFCVCVCVCVFLFSSWSQLSFVVLLPLTVNQWGTDPVGEGESGNCQVDAEH